MAPARPRVTTTQDRAVSKAGRLKAMRAALFSWLKRSLVATVWIFIFWFGICFLLGLFEGIRAGMGALNNHEAVVLGGQAAIHAVDAHHRLILFLAGLCVSMGMASGRLIGARQGGGARQKEIRAEVMKLRQETLTRLAHLKQLSAQAGRVKAPVPVRTTRRASTR